MIRTHAFPLTPYGVGIVLGVIVTCIAVPKMQMASLRQETDHMYGTEYGVAVWTDGSNGSKPPTVTRNPATPCYITTYGRLPKSKRTYQGRGMAGGGKFDDSGWTCAAPVARDAAGRALRLPDGRYKPCVPFGTLVCLSYGKRWVSVVRVTDTCIGGTWDTTRAVMTKLLGRYEDTKLRGSVEILNPLPKPYSYSSREWGSRK